jgi:hypothetical protein
MLSLLAVLASGSDSCARREILSNPTAFAEFNVSAGVTVCFPNIPPHTSVIFKRLPPALLTARYLAGGRELSLVGDGLTAGFDAGRHSATLDVTLSHWGTLSYFAVAFPADCGTRIISSLPQDVFVHSASTEKVCYFSGGAKKLEYIVELVGARDALAESPALGLRLLGNATRWLHEMDASVLTWSGNVSSVHIAVFGGQPDGRAVIRVLSNENPAMLPLHSNDHQHSLTDRERNFREMSRSWPFLAHPGPWHQPGRMDDWNNRPMGLLLLWCVVVLWASAASLCCVFMSFKRRQSAAAQGATLMPSVVYVGSQGQPGIQFQPTSQFQYQQPPFQIQPQSSAPINLMYQYGVPILT